MTRITVRRNGHYFVEGDDVVLVDGEGREYQIPNRRGFALCRCGGSRNMPFCDGTHALAGFNAATRRADASISD